MTETAAAAPLAGANVLAAESWRLFKGRFWLMMTIAGLGSVATLLCALTPFFVVLLMQVSGPTGAGPWIAAAVVSIVSALWVGSWAQAASCDAALAPEGAPLKAGEIMRAAWGKAASFAWVCLLYMLIVGGGLFLLVLPGLYLASALVFAPLIALEEGITGLAALERSLQYSRGRMGPLFGRLACLAVIGGLPSMVPLIGPILGAVFAPLPLIALSAIYRDARQGPSESAPARWPLALAAAGWLWPAYAAARVVPVLVDRWPQLQAEAGKLAQLDPQQAQKLMDALQSGQTSPESALMAVYASSPTVSAPGAAPR